MQPDFGSASSFTIIFGHTRNRVGGQRIAAISLWTAHNNTVTGNTISSNKVGAAIWSSNDNLIYNNNFIDNAKQVFDDDGTGNVINRPVPEGGNYWSNHTGPDADNDGFVDSPYLIHDFWGNQNGQDDLPWTYEDRWLSAAAGEAAEELVDQVLALSLPKGIESSLDAKLQAVQEVLDDGNENNDVAAVNTLDAFINAVNAQRGGKHYSLRSGPCLFEYSYNRNREYETHYSGKNNIV